MEPADLNPHSREDDDLKALLRLDPPTPPDDGFSTRVLAALPPPRRAKSFQLRLWLVGAGLGILFAAIEGASWSSLSTGAATVAQSSANLVAALSDPWLGLAVALNGLSLLMTFVVNRTTARRTQPLGVRAWRSTAPPEQEI